MGNISVDYDVLNQKGSPAWYSDLFANIPTPGYKGRMFISTDTFAFYRDNGTGWDLTGGPGTGTITGAGVSGQLTYFIGTDVISGNNNLFYDITNGRLGINTATPGSPLDIHSTGTAAQFNGTTTNNAFVLFQNAGTSKWRIGNLYNSGANDYQIYDVLNATARLTIKNTGASTLIGTFTATSLIKSGGTSSQILLADGTTTPTSTFGAGSVTNVSAITLGTSGTDLSSSVANSTTTPVITLNVPTASATNRGALSSADWSTFNNKQATITLTTSGTSGAATLVGATLNIPNYTNVGTVTSVAALTLGTSGTDLSSSVTNSTSTPVITLNVPTASASNRGALSSADWSTFNSKQATISVTAPVVLTGATISMPAATTSVNGYLTSTDWNTFNNKSNTNGTVTSVVALTIGTTGIDITSTAVTTTTTPVITLNIPTASASNRGALSSTDWTTFNNKQATLSLTTTGTSGAATLVANTLNVPNYSLSGLGGIGGSGTTNYIPKFTASTTLGNSLISESASVITLGTGQINLGTTGSIFYIFPAFSTNLNLLQSYNGSAYTTEEHRASDYSFKIGTTAAISILSTSQIGIGTTSVDSTISVDIQNLSPTSNNVFLRVKNPAASEDCGIKIAGIFGTAYEHTIGVNTIIASADLCFTNSNTAGYRWFVNGSQIVGFTSGGLVGIGNSNPQGKLVVSSDGASGIEFNSFPYCQILSYNRTTSTYLPLTVAENGSNLLVGTTTDAGYKLNVIGTGSFAGNSTTTGTVYIQSGNQWSLNADQSGGGSPQFAASGFYIKCENTSTIALGFNTGGTAKFISRVNVLNATDNALFSLNSGGTLYTVGFSPTATASSTNTFTLTTGTTTWIYTGTGVATWTLPNPSGNNQIYWIKNAGTGIITLNAFSGTNIINNSATSVSSITIAVGATAVIAQDGNVKSYQLQ